MFDAGVCGRMVNSGPGGVEFKPCPSRCLLRQGTLLHFVSLHLGGGGGGINGYW